MIKLDYGKTGLEFNPKREWNIKVLYPKKQKELDNPLEKIRNAIQNPVGIKKLEQIISEKGNIQNVCIVVSDATRPVPSNLIIDAVVKEFLDLGLKMSQITILIATGLHRGSKKEELSRIIGKELVNKLNIVDHNAENRNNIEYINHPLRNQKIGINKHYYNADLKILTGYVEPHFFFGFSGGRKSIIPGIADKDTILSNHSARNISSPNASFGIFKENPLHQDALRCLETVGVDFAVNVCINEKHNITKVLAGDAQKVHTELVNYQKKHIFHEFDKKFDIVVCGNGGYPLDLNLYQAVKSMAIGEMIVKNGGTIISVNELSEGIGEGQENFKNLLFSHKSPQEIHRQILNGSVNLPDQWEIQILVRILMKNEIIIVSELPEEQLGNIGLQYAVNVESAIEKSLEKYGKNASILILPNGPQILPFYKPKTS